MMIGSCIILNCCNSKIAKCFTTLMRVAFFCTLISALADCPLNRSTITFFPDFLHSHDHQHPAGLPKKFHERRRVSSCEKPKITMPVGALVRRQGGYGGGQDSKSTEPTNSSTSSIRGEIIPYAVQFIQLEPQKKHQKNIQQWGFNRIAPLEMSKSSHLLQLTPQFWFSKALALEPPNNPLESGALRDAVTPRPRASSPRRCSPTAMRWILTQPSMASLWKIFVDHRDMAISSLTIFMIFFILGVAMGS